MPKNQEYHTFISLSVWSNKKKGYTMELLELDLNILYSSFIFNFIKPCISSSSQSSLRSLFSHPPITRFCQTFYFCLLWTFLYLLVPTFLNFLVSSSLPRIFFSISSTCLPCLPLQPFVEDIAHFLPHPTSLRTQRQWHILFFPLLQPPSHYSYVIAFNFAMHSCL